MKMKRIITLVSTMILSGLLAGLAPHAQAQVSFTLFGEYQVPPGPVVAADFNGDGKVDLAVGNRGDYSLAISLGSGAGSFGAFTSLTPVMPAADLTTADFNGDGAQDLTVAHYQVPGAVSILLGTGTGSFGAATSLQVGDRPRSVAAADLNGDGLPDLASANWSSDSVSVLLNKGDGSFAAATSFPVGYYPGTVAICDLNGDGKSDLVVPTSAPGAVSVLLGTGTGSFGEAAYFAEGTSATSLSIGELNGDGNLDAVIASYYPSGVTMLLGDGTGSFAVGATIQVGQFPRFVRLSDFNGDGKLDLLVVTEFNGGKGSNAIHILLGEGTGLFSPPITTYSAPDFGVFELYPAVADFNGDGKPDIAVSDSYFENNYVSILLNNAPSADFSANPSMGSPPLMVSFTDCSTGNVTSFSWDFGDGTTSTEQNPTHVYIGYGTYTVSLTIAGPGGSDTKTKIHFINVKEKKTLKSFPWMPLLLE